VIPFWFARHRVRRVIERPSIGRALARAGVLIAALVLLHVLAMMRFEQMPAFDGFWLTLTTLFTVGYGDLAAKTWEGRWATIVLLYFGGIYTLANFASQWFEWRADAKDRKWRGHWRWRMKDHLLILNSPSDNATSYFERLLQQLRQTPRFADCPVLLITRAFESGLPESLARLGAAHHSAWGLDYLALRDSAPQHARAIAILAKSESEPTSDSITLDAITRVRALARDVPLVADAWMTATASGCARPAQARPSGRPASIRRSWRARSRTPARRKCWKRSSMRAGPSACASTPDGRERGRTWRRVSPRQAWGHRSPTNRATERSRSIRVPRSGFLRARCSR
jgi:hypothetical protein